MENSKNFKRVKALYNKANKTLYMECHKEEVLEPYMKYLLEAKGLPKDTKVVYTLDEVYTN